MSKDELVSKIAEASNVNKKTAAIMLKTLIDSIHQSVTDEGEIRIADLGTFKVMERKARAGVNPRTGAKMEIPAMKSVTFRPAKSIKEAAKTSKKKFD
jgi:DNA-binding protein HU-beta